MTNDLDWTDAGAVLEDASIWLSVAQSDKDPDRALSEVNLVKDELDCVLQNENATEQEISEAKSMMHEVIDLKAELECS